MSVIIRLQNLPMSANASNIRRFFGGLAIPEGGVHIVGGNDGDAFIAFATDEDARKAMLLDRQAINNASVRLFLSSKTEMQTIIETARSSALFSNNVSSSLQTVPQKSETMQALDITAPTLPSSFPSYRNGAVRDSFTQEHPTHHSFDNKECVNPSTLSMSRNVPYHEEKTRVPLRTEETGLHPDSFGRGINREFNSQTVPPLPRFDDMRDRNNPPIIGYTNPPSKEPIIESCRVSPQPYRSYYNDFAYDRRPPEPQFAVTSSKDSSVRDEIQGPFGESRCNRSGSDLPPRFDRSRSPPKSSSERFALHDSARDKKDVSANNPQMFTRDRRPFFPHMGDHEPPFPPMRAQGERDFSVRPPWLSDDVPLGPKRPFLSQNENDDYPRKRRPIPPYTRPPTDVPSETDFIVRVTSPITEIGIKSIFEILRGVHIVPKWGIRVELDGLQRPTGYIFIMLTSRESYERALGYDGRMFKNKVVKVTPSSLTEFYQVSDSTFSSKCPPEIARKLPTPAHPIPPPHYKDGCVEISGVPIDATKDEIVRFLGAPGLTPSDVTIADCPSADKTPQGTRYLRALVRLPSAKDIEILLSAKARPLRVDGSCPPARLIPISKMQLDAYSEQCVEEKPKMEASKPHVAVPNNTDVSSTKPTQVATLTCAYLTNLSRYLKDSEVLRLFPSVLIPGDAIKMIGPENRSAYIDFISENNCRRAISEISAVDSKAKVSHPAIQIEALSRSEMENRLNSIESNNAPITDRVARPARDRDPRESHPPWDSHASRVGRYPSPAPFRGRSPPVRPKFEDPFYNRAVPPKSFEGMHADPYANPVTHNRPPIDVQHPCPLPRNDYPPPRPVGHQFPSGPTRRPNMNFVTVFVGNLPPMISVDQLAGIMHDYYFIPGSIRLRRNVQGLSIGEALVDFGSNYDADRFIRELTGYRMAGRPIVLRYDHRP